MHGQFVRETARNQALQLEYEALAKAPLYRSELSGDYKSYREGHHNL